MDVGEEPVTTAAREVEEETGWRPRSLRPLAKFQPLVGTADFENIIFLSEGAELASTKPDINEAARVEWIPLKTVHDRMEKGEIIGAAAQIGLLTAMKRID